VKTDLQPFADLRMLDGNVSVKRVVVFEKYLMIFVVEIKHQLFGSIPAQTVSIRFGINSSGLIATLAPEVIDLI
jgi:hypothetical protein